MRVLGEFAGEVTTEDTTTRKEKREALRRGCNAKSVSLGILSVRSLQVVASFVDAASCRVSGKAKRVCIGQECSLAMFSCERGYIASVSRGIP